MPKPVSHQLSPIDQLDKSLIRHHLTASARQSLADLVVLETTSSTNDQLLQMTQLDKNRFVACIANQQSAGRGRNGHVWQSPVNANIYMSTGSYFALSRLDDLNGLSLACGVAIARMLESMGLTPSVKWPNDILLQGKKLAGILIETRIKTDAVFVVIGMGLNVKMPDIAAQKIDCPWTDLHMALSSKGANIQRNFLAAQMLQAIMDCCNEYKQTGFDSFSADWKRFDCLTGCKVIVKTDDKATSATVLGVDESHALRVEINNEEKTFYAADISLDVDY